MKKILIVLSASVLLIGCQRVDINPKCTFKIYESGDFYIPDSNVQKYSDAISKSMTGCGEDCRRLLNDLKETYGVLYGEPIYTIQDKDLNREYKKFSEMNQQEQNCFDKE